MIYQLHHQSKKDCKNTIKIAQSEINTNKEMVDWWRKVSAKHPLPEGFQWLMCNEKSLYFVLTGLTFCDIEGEEEKESVSPLVGIMKVEDS